LLEKGNKMETTFGIVSCCQNDGLTNCKYEEIHNFAPQKVPISPVAPVAQQVI
jgi:hypothetical protein